MLGWFKAEAERASFSNRLTRSRSDVTSAGRTLIATSRSSRVSRPRPAAREPRTDRAASPPRPSSQSFGNEEVREGAGVAVDVGLPVGSGKDVRGSVLTDVREGELLPQLQAPGGKLHPVDLEGIVRP